MKQYLDMLNHLITHGKDRGDRTGVGTRGIFGYQMRFNLAEGFPLLTTKKVHMKSIIHELLWFLSGSGNIKYLQDNGVTIWNEWADANGDLGPVYGVQWRHWKRNIEGHTVGHPSNEVDQIANLIRDLKANPWSRRHIVSAWNPPLIPLMKLPPCHTLWQCYVEEMLMTDPGVVHNTRNRLHLHLYARSIDSFLGLPFNIASYALLLTMLAHVTDMDAGDLVISFGDLHLYRNHFAQAAEQLAREPRGLPILTLPRKAQLSDYVFEDFGIHGYDPHPAIKAPIAV